MTTRRQLIRRIGVASLYLWGLGRGVARAQQRGEEIRIGTLTPLTGSGSPFGPGLQRGIVMAAEAVNQAGGVMGRPVRLFHEDSQTSPEAAVRAAKKLIEINRVQAILGTWSSGVTAAIAPLCIENRVLNMNTSGATELPIGPAGDDYLWRCTGSNALYGEVFARWALRRGFRRASFLAFNNPSGRTLAEEFRKHFAAGGGTTTVVVYNPNQPSYRAELSRALAARPEVIALGSYLADTTILLKEWYATGEPVEWIGPNWAISPALVAATGAEVAEGIHSVSAIPNMEAPSYKEFEAAFKAATGQDPLSNPFGAMGFDMMAVLALAMEAAQSAEAQVFKRSLRSVSRPPGRKVYAFAEGSAELRAGREVDYEGVSSNMDFTDAGEVRPVFGIWQVRGGKLELKETIQL